MIRGQHKVDCHEYGHFIILATGHIASKHINEIPCSADYHDILKFDVKEWQATHPGDDLPRVFDFCDLGYWYKPEAGGHRWRYLPPCNDWREQQGKREAGYGGNGDK